MKPAEATIRSKSLPEARAPATEPRAGRTDRTPEEAAVDPGSDERELVRRAQAGDQAAFRRLVERHGDRVYALAYRIVRSASDAQEVAQDALVRAWRALPRFRGDAAFGSWLHRIVVRQALDRSAVLKGRRAREADLETVDDQSWASSQGPDAEARERASRLERLVGSLSEVQRTVVTLYYYHDRSVEDVARTLRMPENTVKTHLSRARAALRAAWMRDEQRGAEADPPGAETT